MAGSAMAGKSAPNCSLIITNSCTPKLENLCTATAGADSLKDRDQDGLVSKVVAAAIKLNQGKTDDADGKLDDYEDKLDALINAPKAKINDGDADLLSAALIDAQLCVVPLQ